MLLFKKILMSLSFVSVLSLSAEMLRLDMAGTEALDFENGPGVAIRHCEWLPRPERCLTFNQKATDRWQEIQFTIIPRKSCDFRYYLLAEPAGSRVLVDDVKINGESAPNGSFEQVSKLGPRIGSARKRMRGRSPPRRRRRMETSRRASPTTRGLNRSCRWKPANVTSSR